MAYGDQLTNMMQPFWALPLIGITGLKAKDILPYTLIMMLAWIYHVFLKYFSFIRKIIGMIYLSKANQKMKWIYIGIKNYAQQKIFQE